MIRYKLALILVVITVFFAESCRLRKQTTLTWSASEYEYKPNYQDSIFYITFKSNDSTYISKEKNIQYVLTTDSLIVYNGNCVRKYYPNYFELHRYEKPSSYLYISRFLYTNEFVFEKCYYDNKLEYEKVNVDGKVQLRNICIGTKF